MVDDPLDPLVSGTLRWYATSDHPRGCSDEPCFEIVGSMAYPSTGNPGGRSAAPWYQMRDRLAYAVDGHPEGPSAEPVFVVRDGDVFPLPWIKDESRAWFRVG